MRPYLAELARLADMLGERAIRTPACRTRSASTTSCRRRPAALLARVRRRAASPTSSAAAAARRRITSRRSASAVERRHAARAGCPQPVPITLTELSGLEPLIDPSRQQLPDDRRADERHRIEASSRGSIKDDKFTDAARGRARAGARRRERGRREHGRGDARLRSAR